MSGSPRRLAPGGGGGPGEVVQFFDTTLRDYQSMRIVGEVGDLDPALGTVVH